jgi:UDP:flavonoid glycosyltransferase YjiC (YdhE family)
VRILVTSTPGLGHLLPLLPLATELGTRGHDVRWAVAAGNTDMLKTAGFEVAIGGLEERERMAELARRRPDLPTLPEHERRAVAFSTIFGELAAPAMIDTVESVVEAWRPELLVHDAAELAGPLVAEVVGTPSVCVGFGERVPEAAVRRAARSVEPLWRARGRAPDPYAGSYRGLYVDCYPASLRAVEMSHVPRVQQLRPANGSPASGDLVYVTFGTTHAGLDDAALAAIHAAASVAREVLVTVGPAGDPAAVSRIAPGVRVERFVPQADVLPRCAALVCHAGSGTVLAALAHGIPLVCLPRAADQFANAANVARVGAGLALAPPAVSVESISEALRTVLDDGPPRRVAQELAQEIAAMPDTAEVASAIEAHAGAEPPLPSDP